MPRDSTTPSGLGLILSLRDHQNVPQMCPQTNVAEVILHLRLLLPRFVKLSAKNSHHRRKTGNFHTKGNFLFQRKGKPLIGAI